MLYAIHISADQIGQVILAVIIGAVSYMNHRHHKTSSAQQDQIHVLVNDRLTMALEQISELKGRLAAQEAEKAAAAEAEKAAAQALPKPTA